MASTKIRSNQLRIEEILNDPSAIATDVKAGTLRIATQSEVNLGTATNLAVTPATLSSYTGIHNWLIANTGSDFGTPPTAGGANSIAAGYAANSLGAESIALGRSAYSKDVNSIAIGISSYGQGTSSIAIGDNADAFVNSEAASIDTDKDGMPDAWNTRCDVTSQIGRAHV